MYSFENYNYYKQNENLPFVEKYRPHTFKDIISHKNIIDALNVFIKNNDFPNCILYGAPGIGKTSLIKSAITELFKEDMLYNVLWINASEERGIETVRNLIITFISNKTLNEKNLKVIVLDEVDNLTIDAQNIIKNIIKLNDNIRFCFICNQIGRMINNIRSRCINLKFNKCSEDEIIKKLESICFFEQIYISKDALIKLIRKHNNDIRKLINALQYHKLLYKNKIILSDNIIVEENDIINIIYKKLDELTFTDKRDIYKIKIMYQIEKLIKSGCEYDLLLRTLIKSLN